MTSKLTTKGYSTKSYRSKTVGVNDDEANTPLTKIIHKGEGNRSQRPIDNGATKDWADLWNEKCLSSLIIPPETWLNDSKGAKLLWALVQEHEFLFQSELSKLSKTDINSIQVGGEGVLHIICHKKNEYFLQQLMDTGISLNPMNHFGMTPLHLAVHLNWIEGVVALLGFGANPELVPKQICEDRGFVREEPILTAARKGNKDIVEALFAKLTKYHGLRTLNNNTIFHVGSFSQKPDLVKYLIQMENRFSNLNDLNSNDESPLHTLFKLKPDLSQEKDIVTIVHLLLDNNIKVNLKNKKGEFPLYLAAKAGLPNVVSVLLQRDADPTLRTYNNENVLHAACQSENSEVLECLLETDMLTDLIIETDYSGVLPFHIAAKNSSVECCLLLLDYGDHLTNTDCEGLTRFDFLHANMNNGEALMRQVLNHSLSKCKNEKDRNDSLKVDFSAIMTKTGSSSSPDSIVSEIRDDPYENLLIHPVIVSYLTLKWRKIRPFFYWHLILYTILLIVHTHYIVKIFSINHGKEGPSTIPRGVYNLYIFLFTFLFAITISQIATDFLRYIKHFETYFNLGSLIFACLVVFPNTFGITDTYMRRDLAAISIFLCWTEFMMLLGRHPMMNGTYILMFTHIALTLIKFLTAFLSLLLAFTFCFAVIFHEMPFFSNVSVGFVNVLMMMVGLLDYNDFHAFLQNEPLFTNIIANIFLVTFIFLITILLASLIVSLAVNDFKDLHKRGKIIKYIKQSNYLHSYERIVKAFGKLPCNCLNPLSLVLRISKMKKQIIIRINNKAPIIPKDIIKDAKKILATEEMKGLKGDISNSIIMDTICMHKQNYDADLMRIERKLDQMKELNSKMASKGKN